MRPSARPSAAAGLFQRAALPGIALLLTAITVVACWPRLAGPHIVFSAPAGAQRDYRVGQQITIQPDDKTPPQQLTSYGLVRYRVTSDDGPPQFMARHRLLVIKPSDGAMRSNLPGTPPAANLGPALAPGFRLDHLPDQDRRLTALDGPAVTRAAASYRRYGNDPFRETLLDPVAPAIALQRNDTLQLARFHGVSDVTARVVAIDTDTATIALSGRMAHAGPHSALYRALRPPQAAHARITHIRLRARMIVDRRHGWVRHLTVVRRARVASGQHAASVRLLAYMHRQTDSSAGRYSEALNAFDHLPHDFTQGLALGVTEHSGVTPPPGRPRAHGVHLDAAHTRLVTRDHRLHLQLTDPNLVLGPIDTVKISHVVARDSHGRPLGSPLVFLRQGYVFADRGAQTKHTAGQPGARTDNALDFVFTALGRDDLRLADIAAVTARIVVQKPQPTQHLTLSLDGTPKHLAQDDARLVARPVAATAGAGAAHTWQIELTSGEDRYYWVDALHAPADIDLHGQMPAPATGDSAIADMLLARTANARAVDEHIQVSARRTPVTLHLTLARQGLDTPPRTVRFVRATGPAPAHS